MSRRDSFHEEVANRWNSAFVALGLENDTSKSWIGVTQIEQALPIVVLPNTNHALYPTGGGMDWVGMSYTSEKSCLAVSASATEVNIFRPSRMTAQYFPEAPQESFVLIELDQLEEIDGHKPHKGAQQRFTELPNEGYVDQSVLYDGFIGYDDGGHEIPIPESTRLVVRWLNGQILLVSKGSIWNGISATYDGRHNNMTSEEIRDQIDRAIEVKARLN